MPSINLRLSDEEHAALQVWAHGSRRSLQREIVFRLFAGGALGVGGSQQAAEVARAPGAGRSSRHPAVDAAEVPSRPQPSTAQCSRAFAHHNYHAGKPCPHCGYPE